MAKTAHKEVKKVQPDECECGGELKWVRYANAGVMVKYCAKCDKMFDRKGNEKK